MAEPEGLSPENRALMERVWPEVAQMEYRLRGKVFVSALNYLLNAARAESSSELEGVKDRATGQPVPGPWTQELVEGMGLHHATAALVNGFAFALAEKLRKAEIKYGYSNGWLTEEWEDECRAHFYEHAAKGDPIDVAAYCAFMWRRGWSTALADQSARTPSPELEAARAENFDEWIERLDQDVVQSEYGYEPGEFTVYPEPRVEDAPSPSGEQA